MRALYSIGKLPAFPKAALLLHRDLGWQPVYWITQPEIEQDIKTAFPNCICHDFRDINRGIPLDDSAGLMHRGIDESDVKAAQSYEPIAMDLMDRIDLGRRFSYQERQRLYFKLLAYCLGIIERLEIDIGICNTTPHAIGDLVFFIALRVRQRQARFFVPTPIGSFNFVTDSFLDPPEVLVRTYEQARREPLDDLKPVMMTYIDSIRDADESYAPWYMTNAKERAGKASHILANARWIVKKGLLSIEDFKLGKIVEVERGDVPAEASVADPVERSGARPPRNKRTSRAKPHTLKQRLRKFVKQRLRLKPKLGSPANFVPGQSQADKVNIFRRRFSEKFSQPMANSYKKPGQPPDAPNITWWEFHTYRDWAILEKVWLEERYKSLCTEPNLDSPFVFFALHYQPERTSCPEGGRYYNQYLAAALLASAIPEGWSLVIKEHPNQFDYHFTGEQCRWRDYYDDFLRLPNVSLVRPDYPAQDLLTRCKAVATITGTIGWEALARGKPALYFGLAWYGVCRSAYRIRSVADVEDALTKIQQGEVPDEQDVRALIETVYRVGVPCYTNPSLSSQLDIDDQELAERLALAIKKFEKQ